MSIFVLDTTVAIAAIVCWVHGTGSHRHFATRVVRVDVCAAK